jgi:hypothetical protein
MSRTNVSKEVIKELEEEYDLSTEHAEMVEEFLDVEDFKVEDIKELKEGSRDGWGGDQGRVLHIEVGPGEYDIAEDDNVAEEIALEHVTQNLEEEPEVFNQDWLQSHINEDQLRRDLRSDTWDHHYETLSDERDNMEPEDFAKDYLNIDLDEGEEITDEMIEEEAETRTKADLEDPIQYLKDMFGDEDGMKQAMKIGGIDIESAAREAVATDGWPHFLSGYDGNATDLPSGAVFWRTD